jgi:hypothetical protein
MRLIKTYISLTLLENAIVLNINLRIIIFIFFIFIIGVKSIFIILRILFIFVIIVSLLKTVQYVLCEIRHFIFKLY